jgi:hypothetical protein
MTANRPGSFQDGFGTLSFAGTSFSACLGRPSCAERARTHTPLIPAQALRPAHNDTIKVRHSRPEGAKRPPGRAEGRPRTGSEPGPQPHRPWRIPAPITPHPAKAGTADHGADFEPSGMGGERKITVGFVPPNSRPHVPGTLRRSPEADLANFRSGWKPDTCPPRGFGAKLDHALARDTFCLCT